MEIGRSINFQELQTRLLTCLRNRVRSGEITERGLSRVSGISQPHIHNVLKGKRYLSVEISDILMHHLRMDIRDLLDPSQANSEPS